MLVYKWKMAWVKGNKSLSLWDEEILENDQLRGRDCVQRTTVRQQGRVRDPGKQRLAAFPFRASFSTCLLLQPEPRMLLQIENPTSCNASTIDFFMPDDCFSGTTAQITTNRRPINNSKCYSRRQSLQLCLIYAWKNNSRGCTPNCASWNYITRHDIMSAQILGYGDALISLSVVWISECQNFLARVLSL